MGALAKAMMADEFVHHFKGIKSAAKKYASDHPDQFPKGPFYSYDNARPHKAAVPRLGIPEGHYLECPAHCFDMQKVVEHCHALIKGRMGMELNFVDYSTTREQLIRRFKDIVKQVVNTNSLMADVHSLKATYRAIIEGNGNYPPAEFR